MTTEQKIKEAYLQWLSTAPDADFVTLEDAWKSGYLALLNSLELEQCRKDAERYRLVRRGQHWSVINGIGDELRADTLDAAIDKAMESV